MQTSRIDRISRWAPTGLAALFIASGTLHLVRPSLFLPLVPKAMPARDTVVLLSGIAELICAGGLVTKADWAGSASALLLFAVFPGNVAFAINTNRDPDASTVLVAAAWARLPMQIPLIWAALQARRV